MCDLKAARFWVGALGDADPSARRRAAVVLRAGIAHFRPEVRQRADEVVARLGPAAKGVVPALVALLSDPDEKVRTSAGMVLGAFGPAAEAAIPGLLPGLADRRYLGPAVTLGQIGPAAIPPLVRLLKTGGKCERVGAASALGVMGPRATPALPCAHRGTPPGRHEAPARDPGYPLGDRARVLRRRSLRSSPCSRVRTAVSGPGPRERWARSARRPARRSRPCASASATDSSTSAARPPPRLKEIGPAAEEAIPDLVRTLSDDRAGAFAAQALEAMGPAGVAALKAVLKDGDERARSYADIDPQADRAESRGEAGFETPPRRSHLDGLERVYEQRPKADCGVLCERRGARPATAPVLKQRCGGSTAPRVRPLPVPGPFRCQAPSGARRAQGDLPSILLDPPKEWIVGLRIPHL